jgi:hypothetical protein
MAKDEKDIEVEDLEELTDDDMELADEVEADDVKPDTTPKGMRPSVLAEELGVNAKTLRAWLRVNHTRSADEKNTSWYLTDAQVADARAHFTPEDDEVDETDEVLEEV